MADPAELLLSTTNRLNSIAAEILELEQKAENAWRNYQGAEKGHKTAANKYWEAAVKDKEAARRIQQTLLDERKALIDKLPAAGLQGDDKRKLDEIYQDKRKLDEIYQDTLERKRAKSEIYLSQIRTADMQRMAEKAGLSFKVAKLPEERSKGNTDGFGWDDRLEKLQHDRYMPYLTKMIKIPSRSAAWVDAAVTKPSMLSYHAQHVLGLKVNGTTDVAICSRDSVAGESPQLGLSLLLELKKKRSSEATVQARATLLMANLHSPDSRPILILSDLGDWWMAFWLSGRVIYQAVFQSRGHAVAYIEDFLGDCLTPNLADGYFDITAREHIPAALRCPETANPELAEQIQSLEGVASESDIQQLKVQNLMRLFNAVPSLPSFESYPFGRPIPPGMYT